MKTKVNILVIAGIKTVLNSNLVDFYIEENISGYVIKVHVNAKNKYSIVPPLKQELLIAKDPVEIFVLEQIIKEISVEDEKKSALHKAVPNHLIVFAEKFTADPKRIFSFDAELPEVLLKENSETEEIATAV